MAKKLSVLIASALLATSSFSFADDHKKGDEAFTKSIKAAMSVESRSEKDKARDRNRRPVETLKFFGIKEDMKVLELIPGYGWYTQLLHPALKQKGEFYAGLGVSRLQKAQKKIDVLKDVNMVSTDTKFTYNESEKRYDLENIDLKYKDYDAVLTFRNYHNLSKKSRMELNDKVFAALKPGGIYGVVDHTRRHMQAEDNENNRRVDPVLAIHEILQAGFEFVDYSDLHYRPDDELRYEVGRKSVTGNTDRFTLLFKKPAK